MGVVEDVQTRLQDQGLVDQGTWASSRRRVHDGQDRLVVISEDGGPTPDLPSAQGVGSGAVEDAGVQVLVRSQPWDSDDSLAKAEAVRSDLHGERSLTLNGTRYLRVRAMTPDPVFAGFDDDGRPTHTIAFRLMRDHNQ